MLPTTLLMATLLVVFDFAWYSTLAVMVSRAKSGLTQSRIGRWMERTTGAVLVGLGVRVAVER